MAIPYVDLPLLVLTHCVQAFRHGAEQEALVLAERLRKLAELGKETRSDVIRIHLDACTLSQNMAELMHHRDSISGPQLPWADERPL